MRLDARLHDQHALKEPSQNRRRPADTEIVPSGPLSCLSLTLTDESNGLLPFSNDRPADLGDGGANITLLIESSATDR